MAPRPSDFIEPEHGTYARYRQHQKDGDLDCEPCRQANAAKLRAWRNRNPDKAKAIESRRVRPDDYPMQRRTRETLAKYGMRATSVRSAASRSLMLVDPRSTTVTPKGMYVDFSAPNATSDSGTSETTLTSFDLPLHTSISPAFRAAVMQRYAEAAKLLLRKHCDYGSRNISLSPGGPLNGLRVRMWDKLARINNLIDSGATPENESLRDSFLDLMNYSAIALLVLDGDWPE